MTSDDFDRILGMLRTDRQARAALVTLIRLFIRSGFDRGDIAAIFAFMGRGLGDDSQLGTSEAWIVATQQGDAECRRGAFEEFYDPRERTPR